MFPSTSILTKNMVNAKKILITSESHEIIVLRNASEYPLRDDCEQCGRSVDFVTIDEAVCTSKLSTLVIVKQTAAGELHTIEAASGHLLICRDSLDKLTAAYD